MHNPQTWKVKYKGRVERILIFYFFLGGILLLIIGWNDPGLETTRSMSKMDFTMLLIFTSFIWIPVLVVTLKKLFASNIAGEITIDREENFCRIAFSKKNIVKINLTDLAYSFSNKQADHNSVTFYKSFVGTRGQMVYKKVTEVIGINYTLSWKKQQVNEIQSVLSDLGIQQRVADNDDLSIWERIISN